jgi:hypothetical protein
MNVRPVKQVLDELARYVEPPRGVAIFLAESIPSSASDMNWAAIMGERGVQCNDRFEHKVAGLRKSDPIVDWSVSKSMVGKSGASLDGFPTYPLAPHAPQFSSTRTRQHKVNHSMGAVLRLSPLCLSILDQF